MISREKNIQTPLNSREKRFGPPYLVGWGTIGRRGGEKGGRKGGKKRKKGGRKKEERERRGRV